jgi:TonB family protein
MTTDFVQFRPRKPVLSLGIVAFCLSLLLHGVLLIWLVRGERNRLAAVHFGPLWGGSLQLIDLPDPSKQMLSIIPLPTEPPEPELGAPDGRGTSVDQTPGKQPQQARQADMEQPLLRLNPGFATNNQTGSLKGTDQPVFGTSPSGASPNDMAPAPAAAPARNPAQSKSAQQEQARAARSPSVIANASAGSAPPQPKLDTSKKPDADAAQVHGQQQPRNPDALVGATKQPTVSPNAIRAQAPLQQQIALAGLHDSSSGGDYSQAQPGGPPDPHATPDDQSARAASPPPQATAQSTGPRTDKKPTDDPDNSTDPNATAAKADNSPPAQTPTPPDEPAPDAMAATDMDGDGATAARAAAPGDPAQRGRSDSDPFSTTADATFRDGREDVRLGFRYRITKPHILLKGWVDSFFIGSHTVTLELTCDTKGNVINVTILKSSGSTDIDEPSRLEAYNWWFEPPKDAKGTPQQRVFPFTLRYYD